MNVEFIFEDWLKEGAIIGQTGKWVEVHWGSPQFFKNEKDLTSPAFYKNNFSLTESKPWAVFPHSKRWEAKSWRALVAQSLKELSLASPKKLKWEDPEKKSFEKTFKLIKKEIQNGSVVKAVPVVSSRAEKTVDAETIIASVLQQAPKNTYIHGFWSGNEGFLGFTPEILFLQEKDKKVTTMALAGTRQRDLHLDDPENFLRDTKQLKEHHIVVEDIQNQLSALGKVKASKTALLELDYLVHLYTPIKLTPATPVTFEQLVAQLHPTPALGISPRAQFPLLKTLREGSDFLGSPFGLRSSAGHFICLVAIRNLRWDKKFYYVDNGCGVVEESQLDDEWRELRIKRESVKKVFKI